MSMPQVNPINVRYPFELKDQHPEVVQAHRYAFQGLVDLNQAIATLTGKINSIKAGSTTTVVSGGGGSSTIINGTNFPGLGGSRDLTGLTSYTTLNADNGILLLVNDASPVAVTLDSGMPIPYFLFATNFGAGSATFTPSSGTINGSASFTLPQNYFSMIVFDGTNWHASTLLVVPQNTPAIAHEFLTAYNSATGAFTQAQPSYSDLTGTPQLPNTKTPVAGEYLTGYDATTGNFSQSTTPGISATITTAALTVGGTQGSMTFTDGILTAQTPAT